MAFILNSKKDTQFPRNSGPLTFALIPHEFRRSLNEESYAQTYKECFIELKRARKLPLKLMNTVKPLQKHWATLVQIV